MKKLLLLLTVLIGMSAAKAQNCNFSFQLDTNTNTITLFAPVNNFDPNAHLFFWSVNNGQNFLNGSQVSFTYNQPVTDNIQLSIFQALPDSNLVCSSNQVVVIQGGGNQSACPIAIEQFSGTEFSFTIPGANYPATWNFGDGNTASGFDVSHTYTTPGTYTVCANITGGGFTCDNCVQVFVYQDTVINPQIDCSLFCATDVALNPSLTAASISISFTGGPNDFINYPYAAFVTNLAGDTIATGNMNLFGQIGGTVATYDVNVLPNEQWAPSQEVFIHFVFNNQLCVLPYPCTPPPADCNADFFASSSPLTGYFVALGNTWTPGTSYSWDYGDGQTGTGPYAYHVYDAPGTYEVCLLVSAANCFQNQCQTIVIDDVMPVISDSLCNAQYVITQDSPFEVLVVNGSSGNDLSFSWTLTGNGVSITAQGAYPEILVEATGAYTLCLTVTSPNCTSTYCDSLVIDENGLWGGRRAAEGFVINVVSPQEVTGFVTSAKPDDKVETLVFPNPFNNSVMITNANAAQYEVFSLDGRLVLQGALLNGNAVLSTEQLNAGIYLLNLTEKSGARSVQKIVKQ